jgi:hypothetical protein
MAKRKEATPKLSRRKPVRPPRLRSIPAFPKGPRLYEQLEGVGLVHGPGDPPPGFLTFTNSQSEWWIYWAISKVIGFPQDPRVGPYIGWPGLWIYQSPFEGGRVRGGQVVDFVIESPVTSGGTLAIRIQTERYHIFTDPMKHAQENILLTRLAQYSRVADVFEQDFIMDRSGQAAVLEIKKAIFGGRASNPLRAGTARRIRL